MSRIKLPGSLLVKKILLAVLVILSISIIIYVAVDNKKTDSSKQEETVAEETSKDEGDNAQEEQAINKTNEEEEAMFNEAQQLFNSQNYSGTIGKANEMLAKFPQSYKAYNIRGFAKAFSVSFDEAMADIDKGLEINPEYWYGRYAKAFNYELYDKFDEALTWYNKSLEIEDYCWTYYGIASIYGRRGDAANTVKYLKKAMEVENAGNGESGIRNEAKTEKDFDPVRGNVEFENFIK